MSKRVTKKAEMISMKSDRSLFMQLLMVAKEREIDMRAILNYTVSPVPGCLSSHDQTTLSKTNKSALLKHLEDLVPVCHVTDKPADSAVIIDVMALIQSLSIQKLPDKFGELAEVVFKRVIQVILQFNASRVDVVGDRYDTNKGSGKITAQPVITIIQDCSC